MGTDNVTYVVEFMLGRYCASTDQDEIDEGLEIVQRQLKSRTVRAGEEELFKAKALETGEVKIIDLITARVDNKGEYVASLPSLRLTDVRISSELVNQHERMLAFVISGFQARRFGVLQRSERKQSQMTVEQYAVTCFLLCRPDRQWLDQADCLDGGLNLQELSGGQYSDVCLA